MSLPFRFEILPVTPFSQNCTLIWHPGTGSGSVIDPGGEVDRILGTARRHDVTVSSIILTHGHLDHAGGAAELRDRLRDENTARSVPVIGPDPRDQFLLDRLAQAGRQFGIETMRAVTPDQWLEEGDTVPIAGQDFAVLHCPGHTPGHIVLVQRDSRFAFVGDTLFRGSVGRSDFSYGDGVQLIHMIKRKLLPLGDDVQFICGHGASSTFGEERLSNPFLR